MLISILILHFKCNEIQWLIIVRLSRMIIIEKFEKSNTHLVAEFLQEFWSEYLNYFARNSVNKLVHVLQVSCSFVRYFCTLFCDDIMIINHVFTFLIEKKPV